MGKIKVKSKTKSKTKDKTLTNPVIIKLNEITTFVQDKSKLTEIEDDSLVIKVIDQGIGFDKTKVEIPKIENKIGKDERKRGWGLQLIQELMDSVEFESNDEGTTVTMKKNIKH